jgi:hypothetical protein
MIPFISAVDEAIASKPTLNTNCGEKQLQFTTRKSSLLRILILNQLFPDAPKKA